MRRLMSVFLVMALTLVFPVKTNALVACNFSIHPATVYAGQHVNLVFSITNPADGETATRFRIYAPNDAANIAITDGSASGWSSTLVSSAQISFHSGTLEPDASADFSIAVSAGTNLVEDEPWEVWIGSDTEETPCGTMSVAIVAHPTSTPTPTPSTALRVSASPTATPTPTPQPDRTPPVVTLTTRLDRAFAIAPTIEGYATDPSGVSSEIDYSLDDGHNWIPVDAVVGAGKKKVTFSFSPGQLLDDNYELRIRAKDLLGNEGVGSTSWTLIIDRLPPTVGGSVFTFGPQVIEPAGAGSITTITGFSQKISLAAVGGPTQMIIRTNEAFVSNMTKNVHTGLWSADIRMEKPGRFPLTVETIDGAGNRSVRALGTLRVIPSGVITWEGKPVNGATVSVFYQDPSTKRFVLWDGRAYGQTNPFITTADGTYGIYVPAGTYYVRITADGFRPIVSSIATILRPSPITSQFALKESRRVQIGPWQMFLPDFRQESAALTIDASADPARVSPLIGKDFPFRKLSTVSGDAHIDALFTGKSGVITFVSTWAPQAAAQLAHIHTLLQRTTNAVVVVVPQESQSAVSLYQRRGNYPFSILSDPDGALLAAMDIQRYPTHFFVNRNGKIFEIREGLLSQQEILDTLKKE